MSIFGQVWLWSLAAFVLGAVITWLVLVRPIQARNRELERELAHGGAPGFDSPREEPLNYAPTPTPFSRTPYGDPESLNDTALNDTALNDTTLNDGRGNLPRTVTAPVGWPEEDQAGQANAPIWPEKDSLASLASGIPVDPVLEEQPEPVSSSNEQSPSQQGPDQQGPDEQSSEAPASSALRSNSLFDTFDSTVDQATSDPATSNPAISNSAISNPAAFTADEHQDAEPEAPKYAFSDGADIAPPEGAETPLETTQVLPRRARRESPRGGFDAPEPVRPSMRTVERREPADSASASGGALFAPAVQPGQVADIHERPRAPFGPGSALARPGGGSPSPEFQVKASATAMRYCASDSPQFERMVAEVWFRTQADAEQAGFRSLG
jgi:hypothetical protein